MIDRFLEFIRWNYRKLLVLFFIIVVVGLTYRMLSIYGFVEITVTGNQSGSWELELINQKDRTSSKKNVVEIKIRKLVRKNDYEALATQSTSNGFASFKAKGFLRTAQVEIPLQSEKNRQFIGDNPGTCMHYIKNILYSYDCNSSTNVQAVRHEPATKSLPSYVTKTDHLNLGIISGFVSTNKGNIAFLKSPRATDLGLNAYNAYKVNSKFVLSEGKVLVGGPSISKEVVFGPYEGKSVIINRSEAWLYEHLGDLTKLDIDSVSDQSLLLTSSRVNNDAIVFTYNDLGTNESNDAVDFFPNKTEFVVFAGNESKHFNLNKGYVNASICGEDLLCAWTNTIDVYSISGPEPIFQRSLVGGVGEVAIVGNSVVLLNR